VFEIFQIIQMEMMQIKVFLFTILQLRRWESKKNEKQELSLFLILFLLKLCCIKVVKEKIERKIEREILFNIFIETRTFQSSLLVVLRLIQILTRLKEISHTFSPGKFDKGLLVL